MLARDKHCRLVKIFINYESKRFIAFDPDKLKYCPGPIVIKNVVRNLQIFVISLSVCPWQAFPALSNVCG
jgi:hypothetical protein